MKIELNNKKYDLTFGCNLDSRDKFVVDNTTREIFIDLNVSIFEMKKILKRVALFVLLSNNKKLKHKYTLMDVINYYVDNIGEFNKMVLVLEGRFNAFFNIGI